jgi:hypothetical protein
MPARCVSASLRCGGIGLAHAGMMSKRTMKPRSTKSWRRRRRTTTCLSPSECRSGLATTHLLAAHRHWPCHPGRCLATDGSLRGSRHQIMPTIERELVFSQTNISFSLQEINLVCFARIGVAPRACLVVSIGLSSVWLCGSFRLLPSHRSQVEGVHGRRSIENRKERSHLRLRSRTKQKLRSWD